MSERQRKHTTLPLKISFLFLFFLLPSLNAFAAVPPAPTLNSAVAGTSQVSLSWGAVAGATGYSVKYGKVSGSYTKTKKLGNVTDYAVTGLTNGTEYYFVVVARNASGRQRIRSASRPRLIQTSAANAPIMAKPETKPMRSRQAMTCTKTARTNAPKPADVGRQTQRRNAARRCHTRPPLTNGTNHPWP